MILVKRTLYICMHYNASSAYVQFIAKMDKFSEKLS